MEKPHFVDLLERGFLALLCLASLAMMFSGFYYGAGLALFGLVLFAPTVIATVCYIYRPIDVDYAATSKHEDRNPEALAQGSLRGTGIESGPRKGAANAHVETKPAQPRTRSLVAS